MHRPSGPVLSHIRYNAVVLCKGLESEMMVSIPADYMHEEGETHNQRYEAGPLGFQSHLLS